MERDLVGLLGAGLASAATGFGIAVPVGAIDRGYTLVDVLSRESGPRVGATLNAMVQALWLAWQRTGLDRETTALHAAALPAIIELNRPLPEAFVVARAGADSGRLLAADVLERARHSGDIMRARLDEGIAYALLERLYEVIFAEQAALPEMMAAVDLYLRSNLWRQDLEAVAPAPVATPAPPPPRVIPTLSAEAVTGIGTSIARFGSRIPNPEALALRMRERLVQLIARLAALADNAGEATRHLDDAAARMAAGDFGGAEQSLVVAQEAFIQRASADLSLARHLMHCAAELLAIRGEFDEIRLELRKAARHYRAATRCLANIDAALHLQFLGRQAAALQWLDQLQRDDAALAEAARVLEEAIALDARQAGSVDFVRSQERLAAIHFELGQRSGDPREYMTAARLAAAALAQGPGGGTVDVDTPYVHAKSLWLAASLSGDAGLFDAAAQGLAAAIAAYGRDTHPQRWVELSSLLGQTLLRLAAARTQPQLLPAAVEHLRGAVQFASTCNVQFDAVTTETALGRALLAEFAAGGLPLLLDLAATAFRRAIKFAAAAGDVMAKGSLQHELGMTLWAMADRAGQTSGLAAAIESFEAGIATFSRAGASERAAAVRADLDKLMTTNGHAVAALSFSVTHQ